MHISRYTLAVLAVTIFSVVAQGQTGQSTHQRVLAGTDWRLVSLGPAGAEAGVIAGTTVTLKLGEDGRANGSTGCNSYSGTYQVRGDNIFFSRLVSTRRACLDQNANEQEQRFLSALEAANRFRLSSNRLTILSDRGRNVLNFVNNSEPVSQEQTFTDTIAGLSQLNCPFQRRQIHDAQRYRDYNSLGIDIFHCLQRSRS